MIKFQLHNDLTYNNLELHIKHSTLDNVKL